jgi:hypothetical protein
MSTETFMSEYKRETSHPRLRHFLLDFGKCRFSRLFLCSHNHTSMISEIQGVYRSMLIK